MSIEYLCVYSTTKKAQGLTRARIAYINAILIMLFWLVSFNSCQNTSESRDQREKDKISQIEQAIEENKPNVKVLIHAGIEQAKDSLTYYEYYAQYIKYYCMSSTPDSMQYYADQVLNFALKQKPSPRINSLLAYVYMLKGSHKFNFLKVDDDVIRNYQTAYEHFINSDALEKAPLACANLADTYLFLNKLPEAAHWYRRALYLIDSLKLPTEKYLSINAGMASTCLKFKDFKQTKHYLNSVEPYFDSLTLNMKAYYLTTQGNYYYYKHDYIHARKTFERLKNELQFEGKEDTFSMYYCLLNLADTYLNTGEREQAQVLLDKIDPFLLAHHDDVGYYYSQTIRMGIATQSGNAAALDTLIPNTNKDIINVPYQVRGIRNKYLRQYYESVHNYQAAYINLKHDIQKNDSLEHKRMDMQTSDMLERFMQDTLRLHHDLIIQQQKASLQEARTWTVAIICIATLLALTLTLWIMHAHKRELQNKMSIMQLKLFSARGRITPHFTFNVLNNSIINSDSKEAQTLMDLSRLIRANLDLSVRPHVSLKEEIEFVKQYIKVESRIVGNDFAFHLDIDPHVQTDNIQIPSMFLQIITENAIVHGLKGWEGHKELRICMSSTHGGTLISVCDNGPGFNIRSTGVCKRTGLNIITRTIAINNEHNKKKMRFEMHNIQGKNDSIEGCEATLYIPDKMHFID